VWIWAANFQIAAHVGNLLEAPRVKFFIVARVGNLLEAPRVKFFIVARVGNLEAGIGVNLGLIL